MFFFYTHYPFIYTLVEIRIFLINFIFSFSHFSVYYEQILKFTFVFCCLSALYNVVESQAPTTEEMIAILDDYDTKSKEICNKNVKANWAVATDQENDALKEDQVINNFSTFINFQYIFFVLFVSFFELYHESFPYHL